MSPSPEEPDDLPRHAPPGAPLTGARTDSRPSFRQRLASRFGTEVDPGIDLRDRSEPGEDSLGLVRKLSEHGPVAGRYELREEIARGGMGTVLRVWDDDLRRNLAMKVLRSKEPVLDGKDGTPVDREKLVRFLEEAQITGQLDHPGIVPVHDLGIDAEGRCYFTMRLVRGRELKDVLDDAREGRGNWTRTRALTLILKVCETMAFAHAKGVVHRDLKPSNVMVGRYGEVYVMDWGLARVLGRKDDRPRETAAREPSSLSIVRTLRKDESERDPTSPLVTMDGDVVGTPSYMAIEQAQGKLDEIGPHSDVYSLGTILYYMLTGRSPYVSPGERVSPHVVLARVLAGPPEPVSKYAKDQPAELIAITEKAMRRDPADRYATMEEVAEDIQAYLEDRVVSAYEGGAFAETRKWVVRNRVLAVMISAMALLVVASAIGFAVQKQKRIRELGAEQVQTREARDAAEASAKEAQAALALAEKRREESEANAALAEEKRSEAERSGYVANVTAADYSLRLDDVTEARIRLTASSNLLREWEWWHLYRRAYPALTTWPSKDRRALDTIHWSRDAKRLYALSSEGRLRTLDARTGRALSPDSISLAGAAAVVLGSLVPLTASFSPDETLVAVAGAGNTVTVFDRARSTRVGELPGSGDRGHGARVGSVAFRPDGSGLVTGADNGSLILWDEQLAHVREFDPHSGAVTDLAWAPDADRFASISSDGALRVWDARTGARLVDVPGRGRALRAVVWGRDGERLYTGGEDAVVQVWNSADGTLVGSLSAHHGPVRSLALSPDGARLASGSEDKTIRVWTLASGSSVALRGHEEPVLDLEFHPDGATLASCDSKGEIKTWDVRGDLTETELTLHQRRVTATAFTPDGKTILSGDEAGELVVWDALAGTPTARLRGHEGAITAVAFSRDGRHAFSASADGSVRRWALPAGREVAYFGHDGPVTGMVLLNDGARLLTASSDRMLRTFDVETQALEEEVEGYRAPLENLDLSPDGSTLVGTSNNYVVLRRLDGSGDAAGPFHRTSAFQDCAFGPGGRRIVTGSLRGEVCIWDAETGRVRSFRRDHNGAALALAFQPRGKRFASGGADGTIRVRDADTGETMLVLHWPGHEVTSLSFSPDGTRLLGAASDGAMRIWETGQVQERRRAYLRVRELRARAAPLVDAAFDRAYVLTEVLRELQRDRTMSEDVRQEAIRLANLRGDDARALAERSLAEALEPDASPALLQHALERARAAQGISGSGAGATVRLALGVCLVRTGRWEEGRAMLETPLPDEEQGDTGLAKGEGAVRETIRRLFLAMACFHLEDATAGGRALEEAERALATDADLASHREELRGVLEEVEALRGNG